MLLFSVIYASFIQCLIDRYPHYLIKPYSYCICCKKRIKFYDLIPLFSFIFLKGRCRHCRHKIPPDLFIIEIIFLIVYCLLSVYKENGLTLFIVFSMLYMASAVDIKTGEIPDLCWFIIMCLGNFHYLDKALIILFVGTVLSLIKVVGFGDIKLLSALSLHLNVYLFIWALLISCLAALFFIKKRTLKFAPFISIGFFIVLLFT